MMVYTKRFMRNPYKRYLLYIVLLLSCIAGGCDGNVAANNVKPHSSIGANRTAVLISEEKVYLIRATPQTPFPILDGYQTQELPTRVFQPADVSGAVAIAKKLLKPSDNLVAVCAPDYWLEGEWGAELKKALRTGGIITAKTVSLSDATMHAATFNGVGVDAPVVILNMGWHSTTCSVISSRQRRVVTIPLGQITIVNRIRDAFRCTTDEAAAELLRTNSVHPGPRFAPFPDPRQQKISMIAREVLLEIAAGVDKTIKDYPGGRPSKLYLCGTNSVMSFTDYVFKNELGIDVTWLNVFQNFNISNDLDKKTLERSAHEMPGVIGGWLDGI